jgi:hypothetical protein
VKFVVRFCTAGSTVLTCLTNSIPLIPIAVFADTVTKKDRAFFS